MKITKGFVALVIVALAVSAGDVWVWFQNHPSLASAPPAVASETEMASAPTPAVPDTFNDFLKAISAGQASIVQAILENHKEYANRNDWFRDKTTPIIYSASCNKNSSQIIQFLLNAGAGPNSKDIYDITALHEAAWSADLESLRVLINFGGDINAKDFLGYTPLDYFYLNKNNANVDKEFAYAMQELGAQSGSVQKK